MPLTREFLEDVWKIAKRTLPGWVYATLLSEARASAGGRSAHRVDDPNIFEKISLRAFKLEMAKALSDDEVATAWKRLNQWFTNARKRKRSVESVLVAGRVVHAELKTRGIKLKLNPLQAELEAPANVPSVKKMEAFMPVAGPIHPSVAFVGASPGRIEFARKEPFVGPVRKTFEEKFLGPLDLSREDVLLAYACPESLTNDQGRSREPDAEEVGIWKGWLFDELNKSQPRLVVALGQVAKQVLGKRADFVLPYPTAVERFGDSGEVTRKIQQIKKKLDEPDPYGDWAKNWHELLVEKSQGEFELGLSSREVPHFEDDKLLLPELEKKQGHYFAKQEVGTYQLGVATEREIEIFLDSGTLNGKYLLHTPSDGDRRWRMEKASSQAPRAESEKLADVLSEQRKNGQQFVVWAAPGIKPVKYDTRSSEVVSSEMHVPILKADPTKKIVFGIVIDPYGSKGAQADAHKDWPMPSTVEEAAHQFIQGDRIIGLQHGKKANAIMLESWVEQYPTRDDYLAAQKAEPHNVYRRPFGDDVIHSGSWGMGVQLGKKEWGAYERGEINAFSPGGFGIRIPMTPQQMPKVDFVDLVPKGK